MFFTRLAVAALSFGSIAQVFAAPIATGLGGNTADVSVPAVAKVEQLFTGVLATATNHLAPVKAQVDDIAANPSEFAGGAIVTVLEQVAPAMSLIDNKLSSLKAYGVDRDEILLLADGVTKTTPEVVVTDVVKFVNIVIHVLGVVADVAKATHLETPELVKTHLASIKVVLVHIHDGLKPTVIGAVRSVPSTLIQAIQKTDDAMAAL